MLRENSGFAGYARRLESAVYHGEPLAVNSPPPQVRNVREVLQLPESDSRPIIPSAMSPSTKTTLNTLAAKKRERQKLAVLTCYEYSTARVMQASGIDVILVGDTYAEVCLGHSSTIPVTVDQMITVTEAVRRGAPDVFLLGDMPYLSYQTSPEEAIRNAGRFMAEAGCDAVKVEVDRRLAGTVAAMATATIPVIAHLGLRPQSVHQLGGYKAQGKTAETARAVIEDAKIMEESGAVGLLLEAVPHQVAKLITEATDLPVIGCVSGPHCDGQVLVMHDILGYGAGHPPSNIKQYANLNETLADAFKAYAKDIRGQVFPTEEKSISMSERELTLLSQLIEDRSA
jgi:3-methyl-2-oxobutanoate hydroxymethyltransferase